MENQSVGHLRTTYYLTTFLFRMTMKFLSHFEIKIYHNNPDVISNKMKIDEKKAENRKGVFNQAHLEFPGTHDAQSLYI